MDCSHYKWGCLCCKGLSALQQLPIDPKWWAASHVLGFGASDPHLKPDELRAAKAWFLPSCAFCIVNLAGCCWTNLIGFQMVDHVIYFEHLAALGIQIALYTPKDCLPQFLLWSSGKWPATASGKRSMITRTQLNRWSHNESDSYHVAGSESVRHQIDQLTLEQAHPNSSLYSED